MTKRERVLAALRGEAVDRVPLAFWLHNFAAENSAAGLAAETLRLLRAFDWDFLKPQSRAQCFAEMCLAVHRRLRRGDRGGRDQPAGGPRDRQMAV